MQNHVWLRGVWNHWKCFYSSLGCLRDEFSGTRFDFMLSNPPYGKSWKTDQGQILEKNGANTVIGYEISFNKYFYVHQPLRDLEVETEGLLEQILTFSSVGH